MTPTQLLAHFERISDAPDAIPRLRQLILDLAVRGKLVPQNPKDDPASMLLTQIEAEKARLSRSGKIKTPAALPLLGEVDIPFRLPTSWIWVRLGTVFNYDAGTKRDPKDLRQDWWLLELEDIERNSSVVLTRLRVSDRDSLSTKSEFESGDILYGKLRPYLNKVVVANEPGYSTTEIVSIRPFLKLCSEDRALALRRPDFVAYVERLGRGTKMPRLRTPDAVVAAFPLPPLAEQHRIVARVKELMALCDQLEVARLEREIRRNRLAAASLSRLDIPNPATFQNDVRFALDILPTLTMRTDQIKQIRQMILNLAVRGRLVPQDAREEPASELLKRIRAENAKLMATKNIRSQKPSLPAENFETKKEIPENWQHAYLQDLAYQITDGTHLTPKYTEQGRPFLSAQNVKPFRFMPNNHRCVSQEDFDNYRANRRPERGDILMTRVGAGIGEAAVLDSDFEFAFYVSLCLIKIPNRILHAEYLVLWLNSPEGRDNSTVRTYGKGASQGNLNLGLIRTFKIPLPPLAEQKRIVTKVGELMALCDRLEASLAVQDDGRSGLLNALLNETLQPADERDEAA